MIEHSHCYVSRDFGPQLIAALVETRLYMLEALLQFRLKFIHLFLPSFYFRHLATFNIKYKIK